MVHVWLNKLYEETEIIKGSLLVRLIWDEEDVIILVKGKKKGDGGVMYEIMCLGLTLLQPIV